MDKQYHENVCKHVFGNKFTHVHEFLDRYYKKFGISHRTFLHHKKGIELVVKHFGEEARGPANQHVIDDVRCVPEDWGWYGEPFLLKLELYDDFNKELNKLYNLE